MRHAWLSRNWQERAAQKEILLEGNAFHVCVTTYETVAQEVGCLKKMSFEMLVIDEAHRLKNETSKLATLLRQLTSARRLLLTGTPIQNNLHELWALLNFLYPEGARWDAAGTHRTPNQRLVCRLALWPCPASSLCHAAMSVFAPPCLGRSLHLLRNF